jgi:hypothetical protein
MEQIMLSLNCLTSADWFNLTGLILGCVASAILFFYPIPSPKDLSGSSSLLLESSDEEGKKQALRILQFARLGFGILLISFFFQGYGLIQAANESCLKP